MIRHQTLTPSLGSKNTYTPTTPHPSPTNPGKIGPRAKCDQVVYEAIAKAAEIIVRSRCHIPENEQRSALSCHTATKSPSGSASSSRFNIEVAEVEQVRSILQRWRRSLHVPLRLDVFYQRHSDTSIPSQNTSSSTNNNIEYGDSSQHNDRELLERWCIDYVAASDGHLSDPAVTGDTLSQLRQVCKKVVILLRTLHCLTRMLPSYKLHRRFVQLQTQLQQQRNDTYGMPTGGYYQSHHSFGYTGVSPSPSSPLDALVNNGAIGFSFYASGLSQTGGGPLEQGMDDTASFTRHNFNPIPTPYGMICICALYAPQPLVKLSQTRPIAIARAMGDVPQERKEPEMGMKETGEDDYYIADIDNETEEHRPKSHTDYIIQDYAENHHNGGTTPKTTDNAAWKRKQSSSPKMNYLDEKKAMSGLSLALLNDCTLTDTPSPATNSPQPTAPPSRKQITRMDSMDDGLLRPRNDKKPNYTWGSLPNSPRRRTSTADRPSMKAHTAHSHRDIYSTALSASPQHYIRQHRRSSGTGVRKEGEMNHSGEYGYAYNNIHLTNNATETCGKVRPEERQGEERRVSSPHPPVNTPPFSQLHGLLTNHRPETKQNESTNDGRASPPFPNHPLSLHPHPELTARRNSVSRGTPPGVTHLLLPPSSLEVLQSSPFRTVENSLLSSLTLMGPPLPHGSSPAETLPFVGSLGSTTHTALSSPHAIHVSAVSGRYSNTILSGEGGDADCDDMPFANVDMGEGREYSIHGGDEAAASSFAYRCATASRLQMFESEKKVPEETEGVTKGVEGLETDFASQLADFHSFGASLASLQKSTHRSVMVANTSLSNSGSATATPVA